MRMCPIKWVKVHLGIFQDLRTKISAYQMRLEFRMQKRATGPYDEIIVSRWNLKFVAFMYKNSCMQICLKLTKCDSSDENHF